MPAGARGRLAAVEQAAGARAVAAAAAAGRKSIRRPSRPMERREVRAGPRRRCRACGWRRPAGPRRRRRSRAGSGRSASGGGGGGRGRGEQTPEQIAAAAEERKWRLALPMGIFKDLRKMYNDAGVSIYA